MGGVGKIQYNLICFLSSFYLLLIIHLCDKESEFLISHNNIHNDFRELAHDYRGVCIWKVGSAGDTLYWGVVAPGRIYGHVGIHQVSYSIQSTAPCCVISHHGTGMIIAESAHAHVCMLLYIRMYVCVTFCVHKSHKTAVIISCGRILYVHACCTN